MESTARVEGIELMRGIEGVEWIEGIEGIEHGLEGFPQSPPTL